MNTYKVVGQMSGRIFRFFVEAESDIDAVTGIREYLTKAGLSPSGIYASLASNLEVQKAQRVIKVVAVGA